MLDSAQTAIKNTRARITPDGTPDSPIVPPYDHLDVQPWPDPVIDELGHDPRSPYVERFWLGILGPSTVWLLRRLADGLEVEPDGFELDTTEVARSIGIGTRGGRRSPFMRSIERSARFGATRFHGDHTLMVRRKLPPLTLTQIQRLPEGLRAEHSRWVERSLLPASDQATPDQPSPEQRRTRARQLAASLIELGEPYEEVERQLHRWRFHPAIAHEALRWAIAQQAERIA